MTITTAAILLVGCAHTREQVVATGGTAPPTVESEVRAADTAPPPPESAPVRPRLSQTITLGQGTESPYAPAPAPTQAAGTTQSQNVVVNNNIIVQGMPQYYGGYAGYGGYANYGGYGRATSSYDGRGAGPRGTSQWSSSGWEGARRTAAPGQTPGIGGNWAPAPSYGPATLK